MNDTLQLILGIISLILVYALTRYGVAWKMQRVAKQIIDELKRKEATSPETAVSLPYAKPNYLHIGIRDYRPKVLVSLVQEGYIGITEEGNYFLQIPDNSIKPQ